MKELTVKIPENEYKITYQITYNDYSDKLIQNIKIVKKKDNSDKESQEEND